MMKLNNKNKKLILTISLILFLIVFSSASLVLKSRTGAIYFNTSGETRMTISDEGYVGVGTTNPKSKFDIGGSARINGLPVFSNKPTQIPMNNSIITVDDPGNFVGYHTSLTIGIDGMPIISYFDASYFDLKVVHCGDVTCSDASKNTINVLDGPSSVGTYNSIAIGSDGLPIISYYDDSSDNLKFLHCGDIICDNESIIITTVDSVGNVGQFSSLAIGVDGLPIIAYYDAATNYDVKFVHCGNLFCNESNTITTIESAGFLSEPSLSVGVDGLPIISYFNDGVDGLKFVHCSNIYCNGSNNIVVVDNTAITVGKFSSLSVGVDGLPIISYFESDSATLKFVHCGNLFCNESNTISTVDNPGYIVGEFSSLAVGVDGLPIIAYYSFTTTNVKLAKCGNIYCNESNNILEFDVGTTSVGAYLSLNIGTDGLPIMSYLDNTFKSLKVIHCGAHNCIPFWTRR